MPKDSTIADLDQLHRQARTARTRLEPEWYLNLAYTQGYQWLAWDGRQLYRPSLRRNRITVTENRILGCVRTELAKMTKSRPVFTVTPRTGDEEDANASQLAEQLMRYLWKHLGMHELTYKGLEWSRICCAGFMKTYWDSTIGDAVEVIVKQDGSLLTNGQGGAVRNGSPEAAMALAMADPGTVQIKRVAQGDIRVETRSPFQIFPDPLADSFSEVEWLVEESIKSTEYVKRRYGVELEPDAPANPGLVEARMGNAFTPGAGGVGGYKGLRIREYWCKPNSTHPQGCRVVWSQKQILDKDSHPFDPMPYVMLSGIPIPGRLWPTSIVEQLRGPQTELNKVRSQMAENRNRVGNPTILASKQAVQDPEKFADSTTMPGGIYFFDDVGSPNAVPSYLEAPELPAYVVEEVQRIEQAIEDISGQHEVTNANVPPGVTAASAITLLQDADDTRLGPAITDYEVQLGRLGQKILRLAAKYYSDARTIKIGGDDGTWQIFDFRGSMLRDNTHVEVQAGSAFPQNKAAKQAMIQDLMTFFVQSGNPPHGKQLAQFLKDTEMGAAERLIQDYTRDEDQVNRENVLLAQGQQLPINDYDDDEAHIDGHTDFQKQQRYSQLPQQIQQEVFDPHVTEHRKRLGMAQQQAMQMQMAQQGQPPPDQQAAQAQQEMQGEQNQQDQQAAQAQQQQQGQMDQQAQQMQSQGQQQGYQAAAQEQQQRHAEESHRQKLRHADEQNQARLRAIRQGAQSASSKKAA